MKYFVILTMGILINIVFLSSYAQSDEFVFVGLNDSYLLGEEFSIVFQKTTRQPCPSYETSLMKEGIPESEIHYGAIPLCAISGLVEPYLFSGTFEKPEFFDSVGTYLIKITLDNETINKKIQIVYPDFSYIPPPLKQMQLGIKLAHIICDKDKFAVWNIHLKPACVYPDTESELIKRGWAKLRLMLPAGPDPSKELEIMGQNEFSYRVMGNLVYGDEKYPLSDDRKREIAWEYSQQYHPEENYLEYAIISHEKHHNVGDKIQFDLLEWGNYQDCWSLKLQILDIYDHSVYEDNSVKYCLEPDGVFGTFNSYSMGNEFDEFVCKNPGYYRIEVSNEMIYSPKILENFVCMELENEN